MYEISSNNIAEDYQISNISDNTTDNTFYSIVETDLNYIIGLQSISIGLFVGFVVAFAFARLFKK